MWLLKQQLQQSINDYLFQIAHAKCWYGQLYHAKHSNGQYEYIKISIFNAKYIRDLYVQPVFLVHYQALRSSNTDNVFDCMHPKWFF